MSFIEFTCLLASQCAIEDCVNKVLCKKENKSNDFKIDLSVNICSTCICINENMISHLMGKSSFFNNLKDNSNETNN